MMVMELKAILTDGAVQQLTVPYAIGSGVVEVFVHFGLCKYHFRLCILEVQLLVLLFSCSRTTLFRLSTYLSRSKPTSPH